MAKQHLYARVPAKLSMFNKTDGYDTFACSAGITEEFAVKELSYVCDIKLNPDVADDIRSGKLSPVYSQFSTRDGMLVQSCVTYLPLDYSGERSTYMVHSLISGKEEYVPFFASFEDAVINKDAFLHDLSSFNVTDPSSKSDSSYPEKPLERVRCESQNWIAETYERDLLRRFVYSVFAAISGKIKGVFVALKDTSEPTSDGFIRFINSLFKVVPFHLRPALSFATRVINPAQFSGIKLKGIAAGIDTLKVPKCAAFDFESGAFTGVKDDDVNANIQAVDFICSLFKNDALRRDFLTFADKVVAASPSLGGTSLNSLNDIICLFRCGCGFYEEKAVLPSDAKLLEVLGVYESHRRSLPDDYRVTIMRSVNRYPASRIEIPKKIFAKLQKLYPKEIPGTKHVIMNAVLDLIHTDAMRDKLFAFIKANYRDEDDTAKADIIRHLCSVFYGGFLQTQLLEFFDECFGDSSGESRDEIISKILLVIRTKSLYDQITAFLNAHYGELTPENRSKVYDTILEQLPEGDELAYRLICFADGHIESENSEFVSSFDARLIKAVNKEQSRAKHPMFEVICKTSGHCSKAVAEYVFTECAGAKIYDEFINLQLLGSFASQKRCVEYMSEFCGVNDAEKAVTLSEKAAEVMLNAKTEYSLGELIETANEFDGSSNAFMSLVSQKALCPLVSARLTDVFARTDGTLTAEDVESFCERFAQIKKDAPYGVIENYLSFKSAVISAQNDEVFKYSEAFPRDKKLRSHIGAYAEKDIAEKVNESDVISYASFRFAVSYLKTGSFRIEDAFDELCKSRASSANDEDDMQNVFGIADKLIEVCVSIDSNQSVSPEFRSLLTYQDSGLYGMLDQLATRYEKRAVRHLESVIKPYGDEHAELVSFCRGVIRRKRNTSGGVLSAIGNAFKKLFAGIKGVFTKK